MEKILNSEKSNKQLLLRWQRTLAFTSEHTLADSVAIVDTSGSMYEKKDGVRLISVAISLSLLFSSGQNFYRSIILTFRSFSGFSKIDVHQDLSENIRRIRSTFTDCPTARDIFLEVLTTTKNSLKNSPPPRTIVFFSSTNICLGDDFEEVLHKFEKDTSIPRLIVWNLNFSGKIAYVHLHEKVAMVSGYSQEIYKYFLVYGDFNPLISLNAIFEGVNDSP